MSLERYRRIILAGAVYDLAVTLPFATPWSAAITLHALASLHAALGVHGAAPPEFAPDHLLFVAFFGTVVALWSLVRIVARRPADGLADTIGRVFFAAWMGWALAVGATRIVAVMLVFELAWGAAQGAGYWRWRVARASFDDAHR
jgi:hypothetical protein